MASGSTDGHVFLWNLEQRRLMTTIRNAHAVRLWKQAARVLAHCSVLRAQSAISTLHFLPSEALLLTASGDNSIKVGGSTASSSSSEL
jgi:U3 small nucleolar RNA-associated protein 21